jgi:hypothetical protein
MYGSSTRLVPRRRQLAASGGALALLAVGLWQELGSGPAVGQTATVTVRPGDTLWRIASRCSPDTDIRDEVAAIERLNGLSDTVVRPGMRLRVPDRP